jgi:O-antigen/teichoic acid export membrane protein
LALGSGIGAVTAIALYFAAGYFFSTLFQIDATIAAELQSALVLLALSGPVVNIYSVAVGALLGAERVRSVAVLNMGNGLALQLFPLIAAYLIGIDLHTLIAAALVARILLTVPACGLVWTTLLAGMRARIETKQVRRLASFGVWVMISSVVGPFMVIFDRFVIGALAGAVAVAAYTIPFQIASRTMIVPAAIMQVLFPQLASLGEKQALDRAGQALVAMGTVFAPIMVGLIGLAYPLLALWLGDNLDPRSPLIGQIVLVGWWINSLAQVPFGLIQARGNPRFAAMLHLAELPVYLVILWALGTWWGLAGMAAAFSLRCFIDFVVLAAKARVLTLSTIGKLAPSSALIAMAFAGGQLLQYSWWSLPFALVLGLVAMAWAWGALPVDVRARLIQAIPFAQQA